MMFDSNDVRSDGESVEHVLTRNKAVYFQIEETTFAIPEKSLLNSEFFANMLTAKHLGESKEGDLDNPIKLVGITVADMNSFMKAVEVRDWKCPPSLNLSEWTSALRLSTMWSFLLIRGHIIRHIESLPSPDPVWRIELARAFDIPKWLHPMYAELCTREKPLSAEEGIRLGIHTFAALCRIREQVKTRMLKVAIGKIRQVEYCRHQGAPVRQYVVCAHCISQPQWQEVDELLVVEAISMTPDLAVSKAM